MFGEHFLWIKTMTDGGKQLGPQTPAADRNPGLFTIDRSMSVGTLALALIIAAASGLNWWNFTRLQQKTELLVKKLDLDQLEAEILVAKKPHLKHDFTFRLVKLSAPTKDAPGTYLVTFTGKIANNGKRPFTVNRPMVETWLGAPIRLLGEKQKVITVNGPDKDTVLKWEEQDRFEVGRPVDGSFLNPAEEAVINATFIVSATEGTFVGIGCHVSLEYEEGPAKTKSVPWDTFRILDLREAKPPGDDPGKVKSD
jgi:hypothetical protein